MNRCNRLLAVGRAVVLFELRMKEYGCGNEPVADYGAALFVCCMKRRRLTPASGSIWILPG